MSQNSLQNIPSTAIKNLHHLLILNLNHNRISQIHNRAFEGLDTLEILTLYENKINVIESDAFRGLEKWVYNWMLDWCSNQMKYLMSTASKHWRDIDFFPVADLWITLRISNNFRKLLIIEQLPNQIRVGMFDKLYKFNEMKWKFNYSQTVHHFKRKWHRTIFTLFLRFHSNANRIIMCYFCIQRRILANLE